MHSEHGMYESRSAHLPNLGIVCPLSLPSAVFCHCLHLRQHWPVHNAKPSFWFVTLRSDWLHHEQRPKMTVYDCLSGAGSVIKRCVQLFHSLTLLHVVDVTFASSTIWTTTLAGARLNIEIQHTIIASSTQLRRLAYIVAQCARQDLHVAQTSGSSGRQQKQWMRASVSARDASRISAATDRRQTRSSWPAIGY
jgi:hypothetical protein